MSSINYWPIPDWAACQLESKLMKTYRIRYSVTPIPAVWDTRCTSPITALNQFHRHVQLELGHQPSSYTVLSLSEVYNTDPTGKLRGLVVESKFDLPTSGNPTVTKETKEGVQDGTGLMAFYDDVPVRAAS